MGGLHIYEKFGVEMATVGDLSHTYDGTDLCTETAV